MLYLDLGTALLIWALFSTLAHEYGHSFMAKMCGCKTIGFFSYPTPGVLLEAPKKQMHSILMLAGGWIFGVVSIFLFLPLVATEYIILFLITALTIETILFAMGDGIGIFYSLRLGVNETWLHYQKDTFKTHNKMVRFGLSKMVIIDRKRYEKLIEKSISFDHSIAFFDKMNSKGWMVLFSLLALCSALMVSLVNWPVFGVLGWFGVEIEADFLVPFLALAGIAFMLTITERLISYPHKK
jgi:hypothetical protein